MAAPPSHIVQAAGGQAMACGQLQEPASRLVHRDRMDLTDNWSDTRCSLIGKRRVPQVGSSIQLRPRWRACKPFTCDGHMVFGVCQH